LEAADLDGDGVTDVLVAGVNNGYHAATLVVLDPRTMAGASAQPPDDSSQLERFGPGREKKRLMFPRSCINQQFESYKKAAQLAVTAQCVRVEIVEKNEDSQGRVIYTFDRTLQLQDVTVSDHFKKVHRELELAGKLDHAFSQEEADAFRKIRVL